MTTTEPARVKLPYPTTVGDLIRALGAFRPTDKIHLLVEGDLCPLTELRADDGSNDTCIYLEAEI